MADTSTMTAAETGGIKLDAFSETVLVIIAILLGAIVANHAVKNKPAEPEKCGRSIPDACYIRIVE